MHPEDRVLVAVINRPHDFEIARDLGWYRVPESRASRGAFFEYVAFYFTSAFGDLGWAIHYYARRLGHELVTRRELLPDEPDHPHAAEPYYKLQIGPLMRREPPIVSLRWRRVTFIHTTWDRFEAAAEINDLFAEGGEFVDRLYHALRDGGLAPERHFPLHEAGVAYVTDLAVPCRSGVLRVNVMGAGPGPDWPGALCFTPERVATDPEGCVGIVCAEVQRRGGMLPFPSGQAGQESRT
jgi:hypothetical protein